MRIAATQHRHDTTPSKVLARLAVDAVLDKKAEEVVVMDMQAVSSIVDYFVLCTGNSDNQIKAIQESVEEHLRKEAQERPWHREGQEHRQWVLLDYVDLVVHIFDRERRAFYDLERLWNDAPHELVTSAQADIEMLR